MHKTDVTSGDIIEVMYIYKCSLDTREITLHEIEKNGLVISRKVLGDF